MAVRLKDIAKLADTSEATVSLVLNGRQYHRVSQSMRERIESIAAELGYQPNRQAQLLASGQSMAVGVLVNTLTNAFFSKYIGLLEARLAQHGYHVLPAETRSDPERIRTLFGMVAQRVSDAVISLSDGLDGVASQDDVRGLVIRIETFFEEDSENVGTSCVAVDYRAATEEMFGHFESQGVGRIALLMASQHNPHSPTPSQRARFFLDHLSSSKQLNEVPRVGVVAETSHFSDWYDTTRDVLGSDPKIDGVFIHNAHVAAPVLKAIEDSGRRVGGDIAVATYDDPDYARWLGSGLSVVREPSEFVADALTEIALDLLSSKSPKVAVKRLAASFTPRGSSQLR